MRLWLHNLTQVWDSILFSLVKPHSGGFCALSSLNISMEGEGEFTVRMALFQDKDYRSPYEGTAVTLSVESMLYVGAILEGGHVDLTWC